MKTMLALLALTLVGCGKPSATHLDAGPRVAGDTVTFPAGSALPSEIVSAATESRSDRLLRLGGRLVWDEDHTVHVFSPFGGRVLEVRAHVGDAVKAGQTLALAASPDLGQAQADATRAGQDYSLALRNLERIRELAANGVAPQKDLDAAQADAARAQAERERALARLKLYGAAERTVDGRLPLRSPIAGILVERNLNPGQELRPDAPPQDGLFVISDPARLWFVLDADEGDAGALHPGLELQLSGTAPDSPRFAGRVTYVSDMVDPQTRTVKVRGRLVNPGRQLKAEMYVTALAKLPSPAHLVIPAKAAYLRGDRYYVFVDASGGKFERRPVRLGSAGGDSREVLSGLAPGDKVVVEGSLLLEKLLTDAE